MSYFTVLLAMQEEALKVQKAQLEAARKMTEAAGDVMGAQQNMLDAGKAGMKAWDNWLSMWGWKK